MNQITQILLCTTILALSLHATLGKDSPAPASIPISPQEFTETACSSASDVEACKTIMSDIINHRDPHEGALDASEIAMELARQVQERYEEVGVALRDMVQDDSRHDAKLKPALSSCYTMYMDIEHQMHLTTMHLKQKSEVCKARDFAGVADANPEKCEEALVKAGTTGAKLGLYKDYNDLQDLAGACDSVIAYMIESDHYKTTDCGKN